MLLKVYQETIFNTTDIRKFAEGLILLLSKVFSQLREFFHHAYENTEGVVKEKVEDINVVFPHFLKKGEEIAEGLKEMHLKPADVLQPMQGDTLSLLSDYQRYQGPFRGYVNGEIGLIPNSENPGEENTEANNTVLADTILVAASLIASRNGIKKKGSNEILLVLTQNQFVALSDVDPMIVEQLQARLQPNDITVIL